MVLNPLTALPIFYRKAFSGQLSAFSQTTC
jgi:hypothetical protein